MSSALSFTFRPSLIPAEYQAEYLRRFLQMVLDYETLTGAPQSPPAESVPPPSSFAPMEGDGADGEVPPTVPAVKTRKNPWAGLTEEQRAEKIAAMKRGRAAKAERRLSADSLDLPAPVAEAVAAPVAEAVAAPVADDSSDTSSKKVRKNPWAGLTEEQKAEKVAAMKAGREAKKAALLAAAV
jgi:hypothetical protein